MEPQKVYWHTKNIESLATFLVPDARARRGGVSCLEQWILGND